VSDDYQTTSRSIADRLLTNRERKLFRFLKEGPRRYSEICNHLSENKISKQTTNRLLNKNVKTNRILRVEKGSNVFYRINDFPFNVNALLVLLDCAIKEKEMVLLDNAVNEKEAIARAVIQYIYQTPTDKQELVVYQTLKGNIIRLYPKLDLRKIVQLTIAEIIVSASGNQSLLNFLEGLKAALD